MATVRSLVDIFAERKQICAECDSTFTGPGFQKLCSACGEKASERARVEAERLEAERIKYEQDLRAQAWLKLCPPLYRESDRARLPQPELERILSWQYGPKGLLVLGPTMTGKSRMLWLLLKRLHDEGREIVAYGAGGFGRACIRAWAKGGGPDWADRVESVPILFLDDLGVTPMTPRVQAELFAVFENRIAHLKPILATTNCGGDAIAAKLDADRGEPLVRRLREFCEIVTLQAPPLAQEGGTR